MRAEKSKSWVRITLAVSFAVAIMRVSVAVGGRMSSTLSHIMTNLPEMLHCARGDMHICEQFHETTEVLSLASHAPYLAA